MSDSDNPDLRRGKEPDQRDNQSGPDIVIKVKRADTPILPDFNSPDDGSLDRARSVARRLAPSWNNATDFRVIDPSTTEEILSLVSDYGGGGAKKVKGATIGTGTAVLTTVASAAAGTIFASRWLVKRSLRIGILKGDKFLDWVDKMGAKLMSKDLKRTNKFIDWMKKKITLDKTLEDIVKLDEKEKEKLQKALLKSLEKSRKDSRKKKSKSKKFANRRKKIKKELGDTPLAKILADAFDDSDTKESGSDGDKNKDEDKDK